MSEFRKLVVSLTALVIAVAIAWVIVHGGSVTGDSTGKIAFQTGDNPKDIQFAGKTGHARDDPDHPGQKDYSVWLSECPTDTMPISGTCIIANGGIPQGATVSLQNIGPNQGAGAWECAWTAAVTLADVRAVCVSSKK